ncbi:MAG: LytTR family DNA-binding domain-containing protein [Breznakibacter sp.]
MLRVAIVEDERLTADDLADTLRRVDSDIEIVAILSTVEQAGAFFKGGTSVDLVFSDIQLPDGLSFDIYRNIPPPAPIIFCTAYDNYALEAFEANGIDYLLKPFSKTSVAKALDKYQSLKSKFARPDNNFNQLVQLLGRQMSPYGQAIIVQKGDKIIPVESKDVALFYVEDDMVMALTLDGRKYPVSQNLEEIEAICGLAFFRANRQQLVNRKAVKEASRYLNRKLLIHMTVPFSDQILVGKLKTTAFLEWLTGRG